MVAAIAVSAYQFAFATLIMVFSYWYELTE